MTPSPNQRERGPLWAAAHQAHASGNIRESEQLFRRIANEDTEDWEARQFLAIILAKAGKNEESAHTLEEVLTTNSGSFEALFWLSIVYRRLGRLSEAVERARSSATLQPQSAHAQNNLGFCEMEAGNLEQAVVAFAKAADLRPDNAVSLYNLGNCLAALGRENEAITPLKAAVVLQPGALEYHLALAKVMLNLNGVRGAIDECLAAIQIDPRSVDAHRWLSTALMHAGQVERARAHIDIALSIDATDSNSQARLASILQTAGQIEESNEAFLKSIDLEPNQGYAYFGLIFNKRVSEEDRPLLNVMESLVVANKLPTTELASLHYGLGRGYEGLKDFEKAMSNYDAANRLTRTIKLGDRPYSIEDAHTSTELKRVRYSKSFFEAARSLGLKSDLPIVVVGMMRSGTTLAEQILSSHSDVAAAGEQDFWIHRGFESLNDRGQVDFEKLRVIGREYLELLRKIGGNAKHVTDKMPANYLSLGHIHAAFPNAKIIHMRRHPVDTAISIWATPNRARIDYAHDKASIVAAYKEYLSLMEHWRRIIPSDRLLEIRYEDLVEDPEANTRRMAEFCELRWDDAMLHPESNDRSVVTPSVWQVRQPVYRTSTERWRNYEPWLGEFRALLELPE